MKEFIAKLERLHLFLVEKNGNLVLRGKKGTLDKEDIEKIKSNGEIVNFIKNNKQELIKYLSTQAYVPTFYKLSPLQEGILFHGLYEKESGAYIIQLSLDFPEKLDVDAFKRSWNFVFKNHTILRSAFFHEKLNIPVQTVHERIDFPFYQLDYSGLEEDTLRKKLIEFQESDQKKGFDFQEAPLLRVTLIKTSPDAYRMIFTHHHILLDGWSLSVLMEEFLLAYEMFTRNETPEMPIIDAYEDYIKFLANVDKNAQDEFWRNYLKNLDTPSFIPFSKAKNDGSRKGGDFSEHKLVLNEQFTTKLKNLAQQSRITLNTLIQGTWALLLSKYTQQEQVTFGVTVSGRPAEMENSERRVGLYINTLPLYTHVDAEKQCVEWLQEIQQLQTSSREFQYADLASLQQMTGIKGDFFDSIVVFENYPVSKVISSQEERTLKVANISSVEQTNYPLTIIVNAGEKTDIIFSYNTSLLSRDIIEMISGHFEKCLNQILENKAVLLKEVELITKAEKEMLLVNFNDTSFEFPKEKTLLDLFEETVKRSPEAIAIVFEDQKLSYAQLEDKANKLAKYLIKKGAGKEKFVGLYIERSAEMIIGILAILKTGTAYVPLDPQYPKDRIAFILKDSGAHLMISDGLTLQKYAFETQTEVIRIEDAFAIEEKNITSYNFSTPEDLAYVIYTSGSTGKPKGVKMSHSVLTNLICYHDALEISHEKVTHFTSIGFDVSFQELFFTLNRGGELHVLSSDVKLDTFEFIEYINSHEIQTIFLPTSYFKFLASEGHLEKLRKLKDIVVAGERLTLSTNAINYLENTKVRLHNHYGPSETHVATTATISNELNNISTTPPIGKPIGNSRIYILDAYGKLQVPGAYGYLFLGGSIVANGYVNLPELTQERFTKDPFSKDPEAKMYNTGDLARWLPGGILEFMGRKDDQVKIRGYRIEPGEIETVLTSHPEVKQCCVLAPLDHHGNRRLVGYYVSSSERVSKGVLEEWLEEQLPDYMVPRLWVALDRMPLTQNGKIDKRSLPEASFASLTSEYIAPRTGTEAALAELWKELLGLPKVGVYDHFFDMGGHSLLATRLASMIRKQLSVEIAIKEIFTYPTIAALATRIDAASGKTALPEIKAHERSGRQPLSFSQERLWFIDQLEGSTAYHMPVVLQLEGEVSVATLEQSLATIIDRHEILRTVYGEQDGIGYQKVISSSDWSLTREEVATEAALESSLESFINHPFDLGEDYMFRACLYRVAGVSGRYVLAGVFHHIASDGWSNGILVSEFTELYRSLADGESANLPSLPIQYGDYALWQRSYLEGEVLEQQLQYWEDQLGDTSVLSLPTDYPRPSVQSTRGASLRFSLSESLSASLEALSKREGTTLFMTLLAGFKVLLYRYTGQDDICVGTPIANRTQKELEGLIGFFVNTLALRSDLGGNPSFRELLHQVKQTTLDSYDHQLAPFEKVVDRVVTTRDMSTSPLFQVLFSNQNAELEVPDIAGLKLSSYGNHMNVAKYDLTVRTAIEKGVIHIEIEYKPALFKEDTIERMGERFRLLLEEIAQNPLNSINALQIQSEAEKDLVIRQFNQTEASFETSSVVDLFSKQVLQSETNVAILLDDQKWSYKELDEASDQVACLLLQNEVSSGSHVAVCMQKSFGMMSSILGVLKAGAVYIPVDPLHPEERISYILRDSESSLIITDDISKNALPSGFNLQQLVWEQILTATIKKGADIPAKVDSKQAAYMIYTSGSTGKPKGVLVSHANLVNLINAQISGFEIKNEERILQLANTTFDASVEQMFLALLSGNTLVLGKKDLLLNGYAFINFLRDKKITHLHATPSVLSMLPVADDLEHLRRVVSGGEICPLELVKKWNKYYPFINKYGPTETTVTTTQIAYEKNSELTTVSIGKPISNTQAYILDEKLEPSPIGIIGELFISGKGVSLGYWNNKKLTQERFIANPFIPGEVMYKTGDLATWLPNGNIVFKGRKDQQVKLRGYRIELEEIEAVIVKKSAIDICCVILHQDDKNNQQLVAYVDADEKTFDSEQMRTVLAQELPDYMVPTRWICLPEFPLTSSGKIDRKALPRPESYDISGGFVAPRNDLESTLSSIWNELLQVENPGINTNFFELGGHSLLATRVISMIRKRLGLELEVKAIFKYTTIEALANFLQSTEKGQQLPLIVPMETSKEVPLSFSQQRLWFVDALEGSVQYHMPIILKIDGKLSKDLLIKSFQTILERHEVLRTTYFDKDGVGYQEVISSKEWLLDIINVKNETALSAAIENYVDRPFDLSGDYMLRACLYKLEYAEDQYVLACVLHHIASDGWSTGLLINEFTELYESFTNNKTPDLPELVIQYKDYAIWQRSYIEGPVLEDQLAYWEEKLNGTTPLALPTDYPRPAIQSSEGDSISFSIDKSMVSDLQALSKEEGTTMFMTLLTAYKILLHRYSGQDDICVGTPIANRTQQELEDLIGFFVNTIALRSDLSGVPTFRGLLNEIKQTTLEAYDHQLAPFEKVVDRVIKNRDMGIHPLFQTMFILQNTPRAKEVTLDSLEFSTYQGHSEKSRFDISLIVEEEADGLQMKFEFCTALFKRETVSRMCAHLTSLLSDIISNPDQKINSLRLISANEENRLLTSFNDTFTVFPDHKTIPQLFSQTAAMYPSHVALIDEVNTMTYKELDVRSNQLANYLLRQHLKKGDYVGICLQRSMEMLISILGIIKAGAVYVPMDPSHPSDRLEYYVNDTEISIVLTDSSIIEKQPVFEKLNTFKWDLEKDSLNNYAEEVPEISLLSEDLMYLIYTSGSTGKPKGVKVSHKNLVNLVVTQNATYGLDTSENVMLIDNYIFDPSIEQMFNALLSGARLTLPPEDLIYDGNEFCDFVEKFGVTQFHITPSVLKMIPVRDGMPLRRIMSGGEACTEKLISSWSEHYTVYNQYGPTETTVTSTQAKYEVGTKNTEVHIGKPLANTSVYIVDTQDRLVPVGVIGELCIGGTGVSQGYLNRPELNSEKFVKDPFSADPDARMYRTGDLARWLPDGNIAFVGRADSQVKIRGYRIELGEIETLLLQQASVQRCCVTAWEDAQGTKRLVGYVVSEQEIDKSALQDSLGTHLPDYMVPRLWVGLDALPLTRNGKIDYGSLPAPETDGLSGEAYVAPESEAEQALATIWQELLGVAKVGVHDNFFDLGGDSIITIQVVSRLKRYGYHLKPKDIFENQTIAKLSAVVSNNTTGIQGEQGLLTGESSLLPIQQWYFETLHNGSAFNQSVLLSIDKAADLERLSAAVTKLYEQHDALRLRYESGEGVWKQYYSEATGSLEREVIATDDVSAAGSLITRYCEEYQQRLSLSEGPVFRVVHLQTPDAMTHDRLFMVAHHLVIDGVSWRILLDDLTNHLRGDSTNEQSVVKGTSYREWSEALALYAQSRRAISQLGYWQEVASSYEALPTDHHEISHSTTRSETKSYSVRLDKDHTDLLLQEVHQVYGTEIEDLLLGCLALTLTDWSDQQGVTIGLEGHGREDIGGKVDLSTTVGWFTNLYPVHLELSDREDLGYVIKTVKEQLRRIPDSGMGYGALRYLHPSDEVRSSLANTRWDVVFNYLGQFDNVLNKHEILGAAEEHRGQEISDTLPAPYKLQINGSVSDGELYLNWNFIQSLFDEETIKGLAERYIWNLKALIIHCMEKEDQEFTPSDYGLENEVTHEELDAFLEDDSDEEELLKI
ncbi:amino acid adenylation domain-containing protein [Flavobacteriaceae bacterium M23B6Z8]